jgi:predicted MFS family arabinose efflux permease
MEQTKSTYNNRSWVLALAVFAAFIMQGGNSMLSPGIETVFIHFSEIDPNITLPQVMQLGSASALLCVITNVVAGSLAGNKIGYKTLLLIGLAVDAVFGIAPYFLNDFNLILACRYAIGIGIGIIYATGPALIVRVYEGKSRGNMMGFGQFFATGGGMVVQLAVGFLAAIQVIGWRMIYWGYALAIVCFIIVLVFLKEPPKLAAVEQGEKINLLKLPARVYINIIVGVCFMALSFPIIISISTIVQGRGLGDAAQAGIVSIMFNIGGLVMSLLFGRVFNVLKKWTIVSVYVLTIIAMLIVAMAQALWMCYVGMFFFGAGLLVLPSLVMDSQQVLPPEKRSFASGLMAAGMNIGVFLSPHFVALVTIIFNRPDVVDTGIATYVGIGGLIVIAIILSLMRIGKRGNAEVTFED